MREITYNIPHLLEIGQACVAGIGVAIFASAVIGLVLYYRNPMGR